MKFISAFLFLIVTSVLQAETFPTPLKPLPFDERAFKADLALILAEAKLPETLIKVRFTGGEEQATSVHCSRGEFHLEVKAPTHERGPTFYKSLRELGFLFPHPRRQISPSMAQMQKACGKTFPWKPALRIRGFHLHTLHPNEWVQGFLQEQPRVAEALVRWVARNGQNAFDLVLLRMPLRKIAPQLEGPFRLGQSLGLYTGISIGVALQQQKIFRLLNIWQSFISSNSDEIIESGLKELIREIPLSFIQIKPGTSEFTPVKYEKGLRWLNLLGRIGAEKGVPIFVKAHVSNNQHHKTLGNFNFLPQHASSQVGIWPHTVMFYGLLDKKAPMYSNENFTRMREFLLKEKDRRPTWYYPETSYWIGMDIDVPLLLTDYLQTRVEDLKWLHEQKVEGQMNFTTGHALGGWLYDWNLALNADLDYKFDPLIAIKLLGEDPYVWGKLMAFQHKWFKEEGVIAMLTAANLQDEISSSERIHKRAIMKELSNDPVLLANELKLLEDAFKHWPAFSGIKSAELQGLMRVTWMRHVHAIEIRRALVGEKKVHIKRAEEIRLKAQAIIKSQMSLETNYPKLPLFETHSNPTGYQFGYLYPAATLYWWNREETQIRDNSFFMFKNNIFNLVDILL
jgi:hypothetical protein